MSTRSLGALSPTLSATQRAVHGIVNRLRSSKDYLAALYNIGDMAVRIEMQNTGDPRARGEIVAVIEHVLSDRPGEWRVSIVGSRASENWEMKVEGPEGFERSYSLVGSAGEHQPVAIGNLVVKLLPARKP